MRSEQESRDDEERRRGRKERWDQRGPGGVIKKCTLSDGQAAIISNNWFLFFSSPSIILFITHRKTLRMVDSSNCKHKKLAKAKNTNMHVHWNVYVCVSAFFAHMETYCCVQKTKQWGWQCGNVVIFTVTTLNNPLQTYLTPFMSHLLSNFLVSKKEREKNQSPRLYKTLQ